MKNDFVRRLRELGDLYQELLSEVEDGRWRKAAELAGALEMDLDDIQTRLRVQHREALDTARAADRKDQVAKLQKGLGKRRLKRWMAQREAWIERAGEPARAD